jgi:hypothetical protein
MLEMLEMLDGSEVQKEMLDRLELDSDRLLSCCMFGMHLMLVLHLGVLPQNFGHSRCFAEPAFRAGKQRFEKYRLLCLI